MKPGPERTVEAQRAEADDTVVLHDHGPYHEPDHGRRRRPTGTPPPLPKTIGFTGKMWLALLIFALVAGSAVLRFEPAVFDRVDTAFLELLARLRFDTLTWLARWTVASKSHLALPIIGLAVTVFLMLFRRWRHLIVFVVAVAVVQQFAQLLWIMVNRPRPYGVWPIAPWEGYSAPSVPVLALATMGIVVAYSLVPTGRPRWYAKIVIAVGVLNLGWARMYLGLDHPSDVILGALIGIAIPVALFRAFVPNDLFPVTYGKRGKSAHLDITGRRGDAIRAAMLEQLGLRVIDMKPVGLEGSGGSTPLKLQVVDEDGRERMVFAKLYARNHVRADRWYKLGRTMLYGTLEDETPFKTVRRFVEYEDYTLRLLGEYGFPTPEALGIVEITPEREYMITMEFFDGAVEMGEAEVDDGVIDQGLQLVRRMWDAGLAHRDIKPANLMVRGGELKLIDVFFVQVRPSPWRQAVDLANMMLTLALRSDAETVYRRALAYFTPEDLAEAFAATQGVASPTQLQAFLKRDGRDLLTHFRSLAPERRAIAIQRWSVGRVALILATLLVVILCVVIGIGLFFPARGESLPPECEVSRTMTLMAQTVPSAEQLPCVGQLPIGWAVVNATAVGGQATFELGPSDGGALITVTLTPTCENPAPPPPSRTFDVTGGCVTYRTDVPAGTAGLPSFDDGGGLSFFPRRALVDAVERDEDLALCGAFADPCV